MVVCFTSYIRCLTQRGPETHLCVSEFDHRWFRWWFVVCSEPSHYVSHAGALTIRHWGTSLSKISIKIQQLFWSHIHKYFSWLHSHLGYICLSILYEPQPQLRQIWKQVLSSTHSLHYIGWYDSNCNWQPWLWKLWKQVAFHTMWFVFYLISP